MSKELHTEAGPIRTVSKSTGPKDGQEGQDTDMEILPHMPHARWESAAATTTTAVPGLENADYVYQWQLGEWSKCSQDCGAEGSGLQVSRVWTVGQDLFDY